MSALPYRTFRWGQGLQVWIVEGRDFRSANAVPDGPTKSIWGAEQKSWLKETLLASDADWKVLVSPTPIVGPDRTNKADNHSNEAFRHEGDEMRSWFAENLPDNFFIVCGDRHWQYHSVHPDTGVQEFSSGRLPTNMPAGHPARTRSITGFIEWAEVSSRSQPTRLTTKVASHSGCTMWTAEWSTSGRSPTK